ncbi:MAG: hypothetical protein FWD53_10430 [Phycisphaerales bacterium]|nr:hypothetical protein [Phycisphaerales bacterium]
MGSVNDDVMSAVGGLLSDAIRAKMPHGAKASILAGVDEYASTYESSGCNDIEVTRNDDGTYGCDITVRQRQPRGAYDIAVEVIGGYDWPDMHIAGGMLLKAIKITGKTEYGDRTVYHMTLNASRTIQRTESGDSMLAYYGMDMRSATETLGEQREAIERRIPEALSEQDANLLGAIRRSIVERHRGPWNSGQSTPERRDRERLAAGMGMYYCGDSAVAVAMLRDVLASERDRLSYSHPYVRAIAYACAMILEEMGLLAEADRYYHLMCRGSVVLDDQVRADAIVDRILEDLDTSKVEGVGIEVTAEILHQSNIPQCEFLDVFNVSVIISSKSKRQANNAETAVDTAMRNMSRSNSLSENINIRKIAHFGTELSASSSKSHILTVIYCVSAYLDHEKISNQKEAKSPRI